MCGINDINPLLTGESPGQPITTLEKDEKNGSNFLFNFYNPKEEADGGARPLI